MAGLTFQIPDEVVSELVELVYERVRERLERPRVWMTTVEVAEYTRLSRRTIYRLSECGDIPHRRLEGGRLFFEHGEIDAWLDEHRPQRW